MIALLGSGGYIGSAFRSELSRRNIPFVGPDYESYCYRFFDNFDGFVNQNNIDFVINCSAFIPKPSVSLCDQKQSETIQGNVLLPAMLANVCQLRGIPLAHISTGCLWSDGQEHLENDTPTRNFNGYCGFYVGTKLLAEQEISKWHKHYIWRIRLPFDEIDNDRNYLSKIANYDQVWDQENSISHRGDFVKACLDLWERKAMYGIYNITNPESVRSLDIAEKMFEMGIKKQVPKYLPDQPGACKLNVIKLLSTGVKIRPVEEAIEESLKLWKPRV